jgi:hypothetical protein
MKVADPLKKPKETSVKLRTRIVAWFFLIAWSLAALMSAPSLIRSYPGTFQRHFMKSTLASAFLLLLLISIVAWVRLLARRKWAWWFLVVWNPVLLWITIVPLGPTHWSTNVLVFNLIVETAILLVFLTDRPSGWRAKSVAADEPTCH